MSKFADKIINAIWATIQKNDAKRLATQTKPAGITEINDIPVSDDGRKEHLLDVYYPENTVGKLPTIINIHGGGWAYGDKELDKIYCLELATRGFCIVNIDYSLIPEYKHPVQVREIFAAYNFIEKNYTDYPIDMDKLFLTGDSAGGHLALLTSNILCDKEVQKKYEISSDLKIKAVGVTCGALNLEKLAKVRLLKSYFEMFFGKDFKNHPLYKEAMPLRLLKSNCPPTFISSNSGDFLKNDAKLLAKMCEELGIPYELDFSVRKKGGNKLMHVSNVSFPLWEESLATNDKMCAFFLNSLK